MVGGSVAAELSASIRRAYRTVGAEPPDPLRWDQIRHIADTAHKPRRNQPGRRLETPGQARRRGDIDIAMIDVAHEAALRCPDGSGREKAETSGLATRRRTPGRPQTKHPQRKRGNPPGRTRQPAGPRQAVRCSRRRRRASIRCAG